MTNSMIPYSFIPGTKAKAGEVNANFISLADNIDKNRQSASNDIEKINEQLKTKADKTELITDITVSETDTDLNNYKTNGTYYFASTYQPLNIPKGSSGILTVTGANTSTITQAWYCKDDNPEIYTRIFENDTWGDWYSTQGILNKNSTGYIKYPNGMILQWGCQTASSVKYPIAFTTFACPIFSKNGFGASHERSDTGLTEQLLTGMSMNSSGVFMNMNWIVIGR